MRVALRRFALLTGLGALTSAGCTDQGPPPVGAIVIEGTLTGTVGTPAQLTVLVLDEGGQPIGAIMVSFTPHSDAGSVSTREVATDATGRATVQWTLGTTAGEQSLTVVAGAESVTALATASPDIPDGIVAASGDDQTGQVGIELAAPLVARVEDRFGNGVPGVAVAFSAESGDVGAGTVTTDAAGLASTTWRLGGPLGTQTARAEAGAIGSVVFTATGLPGPPSAITLASGGEQTGVVGEPLPDPIVVDVRDAFGNPAIGAMLVISGPGSVAPTQPVVDDQGRAEIRWTLGTVSGEQTLRVDGGDASLQVSAAAAPGAPSTVRGLAGDGQRSYGGAVLVDPLEVAVEDAFANRVPGVSVSFAVTAGGGSTDPGTAVTDAEGTARTQWTLGPGIGVHTVQALVDGADAAVFTAEALSGPPAGVVVSAGAGQTGEVGSTLAEPVTVRVSDAAGNPVPGAVVNFELGSSGGSVDPTSVRTTLEGTAATTWTLGTVSGEHTLRVEITGLTPTVISATAEPGAPSQLLKHAGDQQTPVISSPVAVPPAVRVTDVFGNPVPGVPVGFTLESGGGSITGPDQTTDVAGIAAVGSWTVGPDEGLNTLIASVEGLGSVTFVATASVSAYDIEIRFMGTAPSASQQAAFTSAAARWRELVVGELSDIFVSLPAGSCGEPSLPAISEVVDDLLIYAEVVAIDGVGGTLGSAGPCWIRLADGLTILGTMRFDAADIDNLEGLGSLEAVVLHEIGHIIGFGTLTPWYSILIGRDGPDPYFPGVAAVAEYSAAGGAATNAVPVANTGGPGTRDAHWREAHMGRELMTGFLNAGVSNPLSAITVGALADLGYSVNTGAADAYSVFPGALRASSDRLIPLVEVPTPPPVVVDEHGRVVPRRR